MKRIEAVIFDWAGTTVDFGSIAPVQAFLKAFQQFGITPSLDEVRKPMGLHKWDHVHTVMQMPRISGEWLRIKGRPWEISDVDRIYKLSEELIMDILSEFGTPKPYVTEAVTELRAKGIKIGSTTGYNAERMKIVAAEAAKKGYKPDACFTPDDTEGKGRPYPYMIFRNMERLGVSSAEAAIKVGDTVADITEGKNAGLISIGIIEGSSVMGMSEEEYNQMADAEKEKEKSRIAEVYLSAGADYVIDNMSSLTALIETIEKQ